MKVSIIIAAYNGEKYIREAIESILDQTFKDFELIIVDDGSTDDTAKIIKSYADKRIKYYHRKNSGLQAIPRNLGIKKSRGEFIGFCDHDDKWYPEKLEKQVQILNENKKVGVIVSSADIINENGEKVGVRKVEFEGLLDPKKSFKKLLDEDFITNCSALIPKSILDEMGLLDEDLKGNDEYDLWLKVTQKYGIYAIKEPLCAWRKTSDAYSQEMSKVFIENKKIYKKLRKLEEEQEGILVSENKNLGRLFVALVGEGKYREAKDVIVEMNLPNEIKKVNILVNIFRISPNIANLCLKFFRMARGSVK